MNYNDIISALNGLLPTLSSYGALYGGQMQNFGQFAPLLNYAAGVTANNNQYNLGTAQLQAEREQNLRTYGLALTNQELQAKQWQQQFGEGSRQFDVSNALQSRALDLQGTNAANQLAFERENAANQLQWARENAGQNAELQKWLYGQQTGQNQAALAARSKEAADQMALEREMFMAKLPSDLAQNAGWKWTPSGAAGYWTDSSGSLGNTGKLMNQAGYSWSPYGYTDIKKPTSYANPTATAIMESLGSGGRMGARIGG